MSMPRYAMRLLPDDTRIALLWGRSFSVHSAERRTTERLWILRLLVRRRHSSIHLTGIFSPRLRLDAATYSRPWRDKCILQCKAIPTTNHGIALGPNSANRQQQAARLIVPAYVPTAYVLVFWADAQQSPQHFCFRLTLIDCQISAGGTISSFVSSSSATWKITMVSATLMHGRIHRLLIFPRTGKREG